MTRGFDVFLPYNCWAPVTSVAAAGVCLFESDDIISCAMQLPHLFALLTENSVLSVLLNNDMSDVVCFVIIWTDLGPVHRWSGVFPRSGRVKDLSPALASQTFILCVHWSDSWSSCLC